MLAGICLILSIVGVYSVLSQMLAAHAQELAIRLALGAPAPDLWQRVVLQGAGFVFAGAAIGLGLTLVLGRLVASQLYALSARDPLTLGIASAAVVGPALGICLLQGARVTGVATSALYAKLRRE